jgi:hypothetical protein
MQVPCNGLGCYGDYRGDSNVIFCDKVMIIKVFIAKFHFFFLTILLSLWLPCRSKT